MSTPSKPLKVYSSQPTDSYLGGILLILAPNLRIARKLFADTWCVSYLPEPTLERALMGRGGKPRVLIDSVYIE